MLWGLCCGVSKLRGPEEGGPHVEGILRGSQNMCKGNREDSKEGLNHQYKDSNASNKAEKL